MIPQPGRIRRWLQSNQGRPVFPGLFLPIWWDLRLRPHPGVAYPQEDQPAPEEEFDDTAMMQSQGSRETSRSPRRPDGITPPSTHSSVSTVLIHAFRISREHQLLTLDLASSKTFAEQLTDAWNVPSHQSIVEIHQVNAPPSDLATSADFHLHC